ncbi:hypothetical protein K435DRAFT_798704 [Dendrothele bispora CBS 962.96]|uniref:Uncharacterized protein n=1 Tax=Dendrothele bispora (strain CBS 962.96) TaxID=1314807 RepID=A0A4S8LYH0_DENBC|nr:hypothetical protein K435DRAFT_798704 [Dendrothele bispora CBS 962.96]
MENKDTMENKGTTGNKEVAMCHGNKVLMVKSVQLPDGCACTGAQEEYRGHKAKVNKDRVTWVNMWQIDTTGEYLGHKMARGSKVFLLKGGSGFFLLKGGTGLQLQTADCQGLPTERWFWVKVKDER